MWVLDVVDAEASSIGQSFYLIAGEWTIGRKKCHFNFNADSSISRSHAMIRVGMLSPDDLRDPMTRPSLQLVDLNSRFGSFVNQQQCFGERELKNGDEITFGAKRTIMRVRYQVFTLVASRIQRSNRMRLHDACQRLGMHLIPNESKDATHCIMDPGRIVATVKVLWALVYNQPVVCTPWVYAILARKSLSEPLPRCEEFLPTDDNALASVASNYLPNPLRKTLYDKYAVVFLASQSMEELISAMGGTVVQAYKSNPDDDDALLRELEQLAMTKHVLIVEPMQGSGFSSAGAPASATTSDTQAVVERRVRLFKSMNATFTSIQELAASVIFVKAPATQSEQSFTIFGSGASNAVQLSSFPEHLSVPKRQVEDETAIEHHSSDPLPHAPPVSAHQTKRTTARTIANQPTERDDVVEESAFIKDEPRESMDHQTPSCASILDAHESQHFDETKELIALEENAITHTTNSQPTVATADGWMNCRAAMKRDVNQSLLNMTMDLSAHDQLKPSVISCSLVVRKRPEISPQAKAIATHDVNFKRFRKGNGYGRGSSASAASLFPRQTTVGVTIDNLEREQTQKHLEVLEEQERIAEELFAMVEKRAPLRKPKS